MRDIVARKLPRYKCHKEVRAVKIGSFKITSLTEATIIPKNRSFDPIVVGVEYARKHKPEAGGYYVLYEGDGYESYSPAKAFEEGYTLIQ